MLVRLFIWIVISCCGYINTGGLLNWFYIMLEHIPVWFMRLEKPKSEIVGWGIEFGVG